MLCGRRHNRSARPVKLKVNTFSARPVRSLWVTCDDRPMLFPLIIDAHHAIAGLAPAALFEELTGVSRMTFQRGRALAALHGPKQREIEQLQHDRIVAAAISRGATAEEARAAPSKIPSGISAKLVHSLLDDAASLVTRSLAAALDQADLRVCRIVESDDLPALVRELGPESALGAEYCAALHISGLRWPHAEAFEASLLKLLMTRRAHMALSLLAAVDQDQTRRLLAMDGEDPMTELPGFDVLLSDPSPTTGERLRPDDPISRLVDLVGAVGERARTGRWPSSAPSIGIMGRRAEESGAVEGSGVRYIRSLRSGKRPLTGTALGQLVRTQLGPAQRLDQQLARSVANRLHAHLFAAHLLTLLMPPMEGRPTHRDRQGWKHAYESWLQRHVRTLPASRSTAGRTRRLIAP